MAGSNLLTFLVQFVAFIGFYVYFKVFTVSGQSFGVSPYTLLLPLVLAQTMMLSVGIGLCAAAATAKYRDLAHVLGMVTQVWLYATPIIYPASKVPATWRWALSLNPMTAIVEAFRWLLLGKGTLDQWIISSSMLVTGLMLFSGLLLFRNVERTVVDIA
jgi:lipopolysaccharide transport system permease protein